MPSPSQETTQLSIHDNATAGHIAAILRLLRSGAVAVDLKDLNSCTALHLAAEHGHNNVAKALMNHGANVNARIGTDGPRCTSLPQNVEPMSQRS